MLKNFLLITLRNLWKEKLGTFINILGFSTGLAAFMVILAFVRHETSYEKYNVNADRIFRIDVQMMFGDKLKIATVTPNILGPKMKDQIPELVSYTRIFAPGFISATQVSYQENSFMTTKFFYADSTLFDVFTIPMLRGSSKRLLTKKNELIISESAAKKYIGTTEAEGKYIKVDGKDNYLITGIFQDFPSTSHIHPEFIAPSLNSYINGELTWDQINYYTYLLLDKASSREKVERKMKEIADTGMAPYQKSLKMQFNLIPLLDIHLHSLADFEPEPVGDIKQVMIFIAIGIFILLLAIVNFVNLSTAKSIERAKEVGLRKIMGSVKSQLIIQFLGESSMITLLAMAIALMIAWTGTPFIAEIFQRPISFSFLLQPINIGAIVLLWITLSVISGVYPAFVLSSFQPIYVMRGSFKRSSHGSLLRKVLVIFQFIISISIIAGTITVYRQLNFMQNKKLGFDKEKVMAINIVPDPTGKTDIDGFKKQLLMNNNVEDASVVSAYPTHNLGGDIGWGEGMGEKETLIIWGWEVDEDFIKTLGLSLMAGKNFNPQNNDSTQSEFILNESAVKSFGWNIDNCIGKKIIRNGFQHGQCIGVVRDFNFSSLKMKVEPLYLFRGHNLRNHLLVRVKGNDIKGTLAYISGQWKAMVSSMPFEYHFLDEQYNALYKNEVNTGRFFMVFTVIALIIACLGLFALSTYETLMRQKEIGIRKAMGSTEFQILNLLVRKFGMQVILSFIIAIPISFYIMNNWLEGFAYHVKMGPVIFIMTGLLIGLVTFLTMGYHSMRAAFRNPVNSLRYE